jgi:GntR family transcriptional regulator, rspAB operon transcriptional repressor
VARTLTEPLVEQYGVSRSPIRESLLRLEQENLVTVLPRQGYLVRSITASDVEEMLHLRSLVEPVCTAAAAGADDAAVQALDRFRGFPDHDFTASSYTDYNEAFHHSVADLSDNKRMGALALDLVQQFARVVRVLVGTLDHEVVRRDCGEHEAIIDALQVHDADRAFRLARAHIEGTHERVRMVLRRRDAVE